MSSDGAGTDRSIVGLRTGLGGGMPIGPLVPSLAIRSAIAALLAFSSSSSVSPPSTSGPSSVPVPSSASSVSSAAAGRDQTLPDGLGGAGLSD